jgi:hypothetical protein
MFVRRAEACKVARIRSLYSKLNCVLALPSTIKHCVLLRMLTSMYTAMLHAWCMYGCLQVPVEEPSYCTSRYVTAHYRTHYYCMLRQLEFATYLS